MQISDNKYRIIKCSVRNNISNAVAELTGYKDKRLLVCDILDGEKPYSNTVTIDNDEITGKDKCEFDKD